MGRKLREARLALALEDTYSKDELLTRYLNIVYYGQNAYGVQPAARAFFGVDAAALTLTQAALLAGLVQSPTDDDPFTNPEARDRSGATRCCPGWPRRATSRRRGGRGRGRRRSGLAPAPPPRRGCVEASVGAYVCDFVQKYLTQTLGTHPGASSSTAATSSRRRWTPSCSAPATPPSSTPCRWGTEGRHVHRRASRAPGTCWRMSVNRIFGYDLDGPDAGVVQPQRGAQPRRRVDVQGVRGRRRAGPRLLEPLHADGAEPVQLPRLQGGRRAVPGRERRHGTGRRWT